MSLTTWTIEQILSLAHDQALIGAAETVADRTKWTRLGTFAGGIWGEFPDRTNPPYQTLIVKPNMALLCSCPSRKYPCRHTLGLAILALRTPEIFYPPSQPDWLLEFDKGTPAEVSTNLQEIVQDEYQERVLKAQAGLGAYAKWLRDLIHTGMAGLPQKPARYWVSTANRLADHGLYKLADEVRQLPALVQMPKPKDQKFLLQGLQLKQPSSVKAKELDGVGHDWPALILQRIGRHYLIAQGFDHYDQLSPAVQADLRYAAGWFVDPRDDSPERVHDRWSVLGCRLELRANENIDHAWLWGEASQRFALLSRPFPRNDRSFQPFFPGGSTVADLHFYPGAWPFRAEIKSSQGFSAGTGKLAPTSSLTKADQAYRRALSANPWLDIFPQLLGAIHMQIEEGHWFIQDQEGYRWPLPDNYNYGWHLASLMTQHNALLFGEWNGRFFTPLSFLESGRWQPMQVLRGIK